MNQENLILGLGLVALAIVAPMTAKLAKNLSVSPLVVSAGVMVVSSAITR